MPNKETDWDDLTDHEAYEYGANGGSPKAMATNQMLWDCTQRLIDSKRLRSIDITNLAGIVRSAFELGKLVGSEE